MIIYIQYARKSEACDVMDYAQAKEITYATFSMIIKALNNILTKLPGYNESKNITEEDLNKFQFHNSPHDWEKQETMLGFDFKWESL